MSEPSASGHIVVGIDGSRQALRAALWAADEAVSRDVPIRLICAIDPPEEHDGPEHAAQRIAGAEVAAHDAVLAIEAAHKPVKIEVAIDHDRPVSALIRASRTAAITCVGAVGLHHFQPGRVGSTAAALAGSAHSPVAIIRGYDSGPTRREPRWIVVEADNSPDTGVLLEAAMDQARLRKAPLLIITCWQSRDRHHDAKSVADGNRRLQAQLDRRLARWARLNPELDIQTMALHGTIIDYLTENAQSVQLVVVDARDRWDVQQLLGPTGNAALRHTDCSLLIVDRQHL